MASEKRVRANGWPIPHGSLGYPHEPTHDAVGEYWRRREADLSNAFSEIRDRYKDTAVRGSHNEDLVADFLTSVMQGRTIVRRSSIFDSRGFQSGEVDVCICNEDQTVGGVPNGTTPPLLIVEGVDVAVQVKATLTSAEIPRIRDNCLSVKSLYKLRSDDDDYRDGPASIATASSTRFHTSSSASTRS